MKPYNITLDNVELSLKKYKVTLTHDEWQYLTNHIMGTSDPELEELEAEFTFLKCDSVKSEEDANKAIKKYIYDCKEAAEGVSIEALRNIARKYAK